MEITKQFWDEISIFDDIVIPVSGGIDSSYIYQIFRERDIKFRLLWNNTCRSLPKAREVLSIIFKEGYEWDFTIPIDDPGMITRKTKNAMKRIFLKEITKNKKNVPCCYYLKEKPYVKWLKKATDDFTLIISGIASYEGMQRNIRLGELRNRNTFLRFKKVEQRWFAYPLRDFNFRKNRIMMNDFLLSRNLDVERSGCHSCPIIVMYEDLLIEEDEARIKRSKKAYGYSSLDNSIGTST